MIEEALHSKIIQVLHERLPDALREANETPLRFLHRTKEGAFTTREASANLTMPQEIQSVQSARLYFPSLIVHYQASEYTEISDECGCRYAGDATFLIDLVLVSGDEQSLTWQWHRFMAAIKTALRSVAEFDWACELDGVDYAPQLSFTRLEIIESGAYENQFLRRGNLEIQLSF